MTVPFTIIVPTWNRAHALRQTLDSVIVQTDRDWTCYVLDDGSTDGTPDLVDEYVKRDRRIRSMRFSTNMGGVAMNELGMAIACDAGGYWTRLGSDDWFLPRKLELDRKALESYGACFGPYKNFPASFDGELNGPAAARQTLLGGVFAASWANIAMRTEVLRAVRARHGNFVDPRLRNMEDYLFNVRAARFTEIAWRASSADALQTIVGATSPDQVPFAVVPDAVYRIGWDGASNNPALRDWCVQDARNTDLIRSEDALQDPAVVALPSPTPEISQYWPGAVGVGEDVQRWYAAEDRWGPQGKDAAWAEHLLTEQGQLLARKDVLNLGCYYPEDELRWAPVARSWLGIDFTPDVIARCQAMETKAEFRCMDMRQLTLPSASVDVVLDLSSGDHLYRADYVHTLAEVRRVLRPDGHFVCVFANADAMAEHFECWRGTDEEWGRFGFTQGNSLSGMKALLDNMGFRVVQEANTHLPRSGFLCVPGPVNGSIYG